MDRRRVTQWMMLGLLVVAVAVALLVFKVRVAVAGGKYVLALVAIIGLAWLIGRVLKRR